MLHKELIEEYGIDVAKLPDSLQYAIREAAVLEQEVGAMKPRQELIAPDAPASLFDVVFKPSVYGQKTLRQLVNEGTVFAKGTHRLFGPLAFVLWDSERNYLTVNSAIWNHINLPDIGEYKNGSNPDFNFSDGDIDYPAMLEKLDANILGNLVTFLKQHEADLEAYLVGEEEPLWSLYDISKSFREALGEGFVKNGAYVDNIGMVDEQGWKANIYFSTNATILLVISVPDLESYYINFKIESNGYLIPVRFSDSVRTIEAWNPVSGYSPLDLEDVFDFAYAQLQRLKMYKITDFNTEIEKMEMELGASGTKQPWEMTFEEFALSLFNDNETLFSERYYKEQITYFSDRLQGVKNGTIPPKKIIGTGYTNPKKEAIDWLVSQLFELSSFIESQNRRNDLVKTNYHHLVTEHIKEGNEVSSDVVDSVTELLEKNPKLFSR